MTHHRFGAPELLELGDLDAPTPGDEDVLIQVHAAALNPYDWHMLTGSPLIVRSVAGLRRPRLRVRGVDVAGVIHSVGPKVAHLEPGDRVFGFAKGSLAELAVSDRRRVVPIPDDVTFEDAAATPLAGLTALRALRDKGRLGPGQRVLVNGASGGVGTFSLQIARSLGAEVIGVCSTPNVELVRSLGAGRVVDYTTEDFAETVRDCDVIVDNIGNRSWRALRRVLTSRGTLVSVGGSKDAVVVGNLIQILGRRMAALPTGQRVTSLVARPDEDDLKTLARMLGDGTIRPVIGRTFQLASAREAFSEIGGGHVRGKLVVTVRAVSS